MFTRSSVHWADRIVATSISRGLENSSATCASGYASDSRSMITGARCLTGLLRVSGFSGFDVGAAMRSAALEVRLAAFAERADALLEVLGRERLRGHHVEVGDAVTLGEPIDGQMLEHDADPPLGTLDAQGRGLRDRRREPAHRRVELGVGNGE